MQLQGKGKTLHYLEEISVTAPQLQVVTHAPLVVPVLEGWLGLHPQV